MKIGIIGSGSFALALSNILCENNHEVLLYSKNELTKEEINHFHTHKKYLGETTFNKNIKCSCQLESVVNYSSTILLCIPSIYIKDTLIEINQYIKGKVDIINGIKGLDFEDKLTIQQVIRKYIDFNKINSITSLLGPGFAKEIINHNLTLVCACSSSLEAAKKVQLLFSNDYFRVYTSLDVIGAELYSSLKNAIAIASGICLGLGYNENTKAALITRGLKEMREIGKLFNAKDDTFYGLTGMGDLILTCNSKNSRNFSCGYQIGLEDSSENFLKYNTTTVEGLNTIKLVKYIIDEYKLNLPILNSLYLVIYEGAKPSIVIKELMLRPLKDED